MNIRRTYTRALTVTCNVYACKVLGKATAFGEVFSTLTKAYIPLIVRLVLTEELKAAIIG